MKQVITVLLDIDEKSNQKCYQFGEKVGKGKPPYVALKHFFTDIGYKVDEIKSGIAMSKTDASQSQYKIDLRTGLVKD